MTQSANNSKSLYTFHRMFDCNIWSWFSKLLYRLLRHYTELYPLGIIFNISDVSRDKSILWWLFYYWCTALFLLYILVLELWRTLHCILFEVSMFNYGSCFFTSSQVIGYINCILTDVAYCWIFDSHSSVYEEVYLPRYTAVQTGESKQAVQRNISSTSSGSKNEPSKKLTWSTQQRELFLTGRTLHPWRWKKPTWNTQKRELYLSRRTLQPWRWKKPTWST
jgi:fumarate reductase subunit D